MGATVDEIAFLTATEQARLVREREVSPLELVSAYLQRIEKLNPELSAYVSVAEEHALERARAAEEMTSRHDELPPFHGVPISIKDLDETAGIRTTFSCKPFSGYVPLVDTAVVRRLKDAGFIVLGKTNTPEFGTLPVTESELNGVCRNPWDAERSCGGSSGGAAVAVAAGLCPVSHGSDGGGSIRIPASCCGIFGLKPSRGRVSWAPRFGELWSGFATQGPLARSVRDAAAALDVMSGYETGDPYWAPRPERPFADEVGAPAGRLRVAFTTTAPTGAPVDEDCGHAVDQAAKLLESLGHFVEEATTPDWGDGDIASHYIKVLQANAAYYDFVDESLLEPLNRALLQAARQTSSVTYVKALLGMQAFARKVVAFWDSFDVLMTPTLALPPVPVGWLFEEEDAWAQLVRSGLWVPFTPIANITGQPAASLPLHWTPDGLPIGVQVIGRPADEATLLRLCAQIEEAQPWGDRRPPLS